MSRKRDRKRKGQPIARFEEGEIDFLINREFPEKAQEVRNKFSGLQEFWISTIRTKAAILKLAEGDFDKIKGLIKNANADPRDVIANAEYPRYMKMGYTERSKMSDEEKQVIFDKDWEEYQTWKNKGK
jgi:hypothetical protein